MTLLLDTHVWVWRLLEPDRLSARAAKTLSSSEHAVHLSPISVWETLVLVRRKRLRLEPNAHQWVRQALKRSPVTMAPVTHDVAMRSEALDGFKARDPADRFLVATAIEHNFVLVTADEAMRRYNGVETLW
jgi:PIN domain nuclease of toxin-antitoxin system